MIFLLTVGICTAIIGLMVLNLYSRKGNKGETDILDSDFNDHDKN